MSYGDGFVNGLIWGMVGTSIAWFVILLVRRAVVSQFEIRRS